MMPIFSEHSLVNYSFLSDFYLCEVARGYSRVQQCACIRHFLILFEKPGTAQEFKVQALQLLLLPMLTHSFAHDTANEVLPQDVISTIINRLLGGEQLAAYDEALRIELLKLATLLIEHVPSQLVQHRKELIKFSWNHLKSEDTQSKQCAYVNVCRFIQVYDTPPKIILQVYVALLRTFQPDARALVKQALDILTPALPMRLPACDHKYPTWIKWTKKIIVEEGHSLPQLIHIWQLIVRYKSLTCQFPHMSHPKFPIYHPILFLIFYDQAPGTLPLERRAVRTPDGQQPQPYRPLSQLLRGEPKARGRSR